jgi:hypothetical protein
MFSALLSALFLLLPHGTIHQTGSATAPHEAGHHFQVFCGSAQPLCV